MSKKTPGPVIQPIVPCAGGLATRFPSDQTFRRGGALAVASNIRAAAGRLGNSPGYETAGIAPALAGPLLLITQAEINSGEFQILGDTQNLYSVGNSSAPQVKAGAAGAVAGLSWIFQDAQVLLFSGVETTIQWSQLYGPGDSTFANPAAANTTVTVDTPGLYGFQLSATQDGVQVVAETTVRFITASVPDVDTDQSGPVLILGQMLGASVPTNFGSDGINATWSVTSGSGTLSTTTGTLQPTLSVASGATVVRLTLTSSAFGQSFTTYSEGTITYETPEVCGIHPPWFDEITLPYVNAGDSTSGFTEIDPSPNFSLATSGSYLYGAYLDDGSLPNEHFTQVIPANVGGDFLLTAEVQSAVNGYNTGIYFFFLAADLRTGWRFNICSSPDFSIAPVQQIGLGCDLQDDWGDISAIEEVTSTADLSNWTSVSIQRVGNQVTFIVGGTDVVGPVTTPLIGTGCFALSMNLGYSQGDEVRWRNISIVNI